MADESVRLGGLPADRTTLQFFYQNEILLQYGILMPRWVPAQQALNVVIALTKKTKAASPWLQTWG